MKLAKLSMPRRRVRGSADVFRVANRIAGAHALGVTPKATSAENTSLVMPISLR